MNVFHGPYHIKFKRNMAMPRNAATPSGAGIVPFRIVDNKLQFLLGKERYDSNWKGSLCWSGFEGGNKHVESCEENASREFAEETLCIFGRDLASLQASLQEFALKICFTFSRNHISRNHVTFLKYLSAAHDQDDQMVFSQTRGYISQIYSLSVMFCQAAANAPREYPFVREGDQIRRHGRVYAIGRVNSVKVEGKYLLVEFLMHSGRSVDLQWVKYRYGAYPTSYLQWFQCRTRLEDLLRTPPNQVCADHSAITVTRINDIITGVNVNVDFLEKIEIRWWSLPELRAAVTENARIFRPYFVPILKTIIDEFDDAPEKT